MSILHSLKTHPVLKGGIILTCAGLISRILGFFYRIFLSRIIGAEGMGIYQLIFPVFGILMSLCASGMQTAISRSVAASASRREAFAAFVCGLFLSGAMAFTASILLYTNAGRIAQYFLSETRCTDLLKILALAIIPACIHACINGFYYGIQKASVPSATQLAEQFSRMCFVWIAVRIFSQNGSSFPLTACIWALVAGECAATLFSVTVFSFRPQPLSFRISYSEIRNSLGMLLPLVIPLTANRLMTSILSSTESILIPSRLEVFGHSSRTALSLYGVLTGMSMPLILFPTAVTGSVAVMLLPSVAQAQANKDGSQIHRAVYNTIKYCLLLGILCSGLFLIHGYEMGTVLFHNGMAGDFLTTLSWICPFLYLSSTLSSILNGLGKTTLVFFLNITGVILRILFIMFLVPKHGILAYLWGLLGSLLIQTAGELVLLRPFMTVPFPAFRFIMIPLFCLGIAAGCEFAMEPLLRLITGLPVVIILGARLFITSVFYVFFYFLYFWMTKKETGL